MIPLTLQTAPHTTKGWMRAAARGPNPGQGNQSIAAGVPGAALTVTPPPSVTDWMRPAARQPNPPIPGAPLTVMPPPSVGDWMRPASRGPNPPGQGNQNIGAGIPTNLQWGNSGLRGVQRQPNPAPLDGWYPSTSTSNAGAHGPPNVVGPWVEQLEPKLPAMGLLHRAGVPDVKVQILWDAGCQMQPGGAHVCTVFAQELGPADLVRFQLPNGFQGRAKGHRVYQTPGGQLTDNPRVLSNVATYKKAWLPASYTEQKPAGITGTWAQVSPADAQIALVRVPGGVAQQAYVFQVRQDGQGRLRALVRWKQISEPTANPRGNFLVHTGVDNSRLLCRVAPNAPGCIRKDIVQGNPGPRRRSRRPLGTTTTRSGQTCHKQCSHLSGAARFRCVRDCQRGGTTISAPAGAATRGQTCHKQCSHLSGAARFRCVRDCQRGGTTISGAATGVGLGGRAKPDPCKFNHYGKKCQEHLAAQCPPGTEWVLATQQCRPSGASLPGQRWSNPAVSAAAARAAVNRGSLVGAVATGRAKVVLDRNGLSMKAA